MGSNPAEEKDLEVPTAAPSTNDESTSDVESANYRKPAEKGNGAHTDKKVDLEKLDSNVIQVRKEEDDPFQHLPPDEAAVLKRQVDIPVVATSYWTLYRFATFNDKLIIALSAICAIAGGAALPLMTIVFGNLSGQFQGLFTGGIPREEFNSILVHNVLYFIYIAIAEFVTVYIATVGFIYTGEHIRRRMVVRAPKRRRLRGREGVSLGNLAIQLEE
jgi:ATP-binding cassette subfamily B (MDR/TAP) protein 1